MMENSCSMMEKRQCSSVPSMTCDDTPRTVCMQVPSQDCQESQDCKDVPKVGLELECLLFPMINVTAGKLSEGSQNGLQRCYGTRVQGKEGLQLG